MSILLGGDHYPALVVSLDFELRWGVGGSVTGPEHPYWPNIIGARKAADRLLTLFKERSIHATWATVGFLFAHSHNDLEAFMPDVLPVYEKRGRNNYYLLQSNRGEVDEIRFAPEIVKRILETDGQELASHSFSHYYCSEPGQGSHSFVSDLESAKSIAGRLGAAPRSFVFPSNQVNPAYLSLLADAGFRVYRGNPEVRRPIMLSAFPEKSRKVVGRGWRRLDKYWNLTGHNTVPWSDVIREVPRNVRASRFLRPHSSKFAMLETLQVRRVVKGFEEAVRRNEIYHLWWHPHNFGRNIENNMSNLERILDGYERLRVRHGMLSLTMEEAAMEAERLFAGQVSVGDQASNG